MCSTLYCGVSPRKLYERSDKQAFEPKALRIGSLTTCQQSNVVTKNKNQTIESFTYFTLDFNCLISIFYNLDLFL